MAHTRSPSGDLPSAAAEGTFVTFAQGIGARSMRLSQRRPLALCEVPMAGAHRIAVDTFGCNAPAPSALDCVVNVRQTPWFDAQHDGSGRHEDVEQQPQQRTR